MKRKEKSQKGKSSMFCLKGSLELKFFQVAHKVKHGFTGVAGRKGVSKWKKDVKTAVELS